MVVGQQFLPVRQGRHSFEKQATDALVQQAVAVGAESGVVPNFVVHGQANEPAIQQVEIDMLCQLPFWTDGKQDVL
ncbi:hypothetical protein A1355_10435 [Methylomonas koyamae]|uniref:Uncharacterized protein n=1 Tax=Methylomonas koyamae TaxID=702114 RepID=A0A177NCY0_9GAMM|nr:hypothetical protein A1355_10435 [Methylomonas koyamae]